MGTEASPLLMEIVMLVADRGRISAEISKVLVGGRAKVAPAAGRAILRWEMDLPRSLRS